MPLILPARTLDSGYEIDNSLRMGPSGGSNTPHVNLRRTLGSAGTEETFTYSCWVKISAKSQYNFWLLGGSQETSGAYQATFFRIQTDNKLRLSDSSPDGTTNIETNRLFRDPSAFYNIVLAVDSTQGTSSNRVKIYVNGVQETSFANETYPSQNTAFRVLENGVTQTIGTWIADDGSAFGCDDGYISEVYLIDGQQLDSSYFGETNANGVWVPKDYTGTYGTHGFRFEFKQTGSSANSSGIGADTSGNDNHFSVNNFATTDIATDTPTNNFATLNPLSNSLQASYSEGNLNEACNDNFGVGATQAFANGKWYWEVKITAGDNNLVGIANADFVDQLPVTFGINNYSLTVYGVNGQIQREGSLVEDVSDTYGANDIVGVAVDMDSGTRTVQFYKNGSTFGSATTLPTGWGFTIPIIRKGGSSQTSSFNFGNPAFAISSGNSDGAGFGNFEYAVPSGYFALCTKNLAEFG